MITLTREVCPMSPIPSPQDAHRLPLLTERQAVSLERLFEVLASATRLRLLQALTSMDDPCMGDLAEAVGMKPAAVSNQLRRLADMGILDTRRHGSHIHYRIVDARVAELLAHGLRLAGAVPQDPEGGQA